MYDEESLESAVQSVWELAIALATLKHIASIASTGYTAETKIKANDEGKVTNCEKTESGDVELAALASSLTLNMVCQQNKSNDKSMSSMTDHTQEAAPKDLCSMATQIISTSDDQENTSNIVHQVTKEDRTAAGTYRSSMEGLYEPQVSMAAHYPDSMLCQETGPDCSIAQQLLETEMCSEYLPSMVAHQVTVADIPLEYAETPVSMVSHVIIRDKEWLMEKDTITSMKEHQLSIPEKLEMESLQNISTTKESLLYTNIQLSSMETKNRDPKYFAPHKHEKVKYGLEKTETDKNNFILSLSSHQASSTPAEDADRYTSLASHQDIIQSQEDMNSLVSMAAHIAGSQYTPDIITNKPERKTSSKNESKDTNLFKIENAGKISDETSKTEIDKRNIYSSKKDDRINDSLQILEENEISLPESENKTKFTKLNTIEESTETHIMTNFKGVEIKSCIVLHQHFNDKGTFDSEPSMSNNMQCANPVFENPDVANLITASCTIEDNRPVISKTLNHNKDIGSESDNYKKNNQSASNNNRKEKGMKDKDKNRPELKDKAKGSEIRNSEASKRIGCARKKQTESITLNGNSKKQYYKIRFKVKLGEDPSKPSALKYLFEYLGGQN